MGWSLAALAVLLVGLGMRAVLGGVGVGDRSAMVMSVLLALGAWAAARLLGGPRLALVVTVLVVALLDLSALPQRAPPAYDDLQAFYRPDQVLTTQVQAPVGVEGGAVLTVVGQAVFAGAQPAFGIAGQVNGAALAWNCTFGRGVQTLGLPLPDGLIQGGQPADVQLHLSGAPTRESDYLVVYSSSQRGGFLVALAPEEGLDSSVTRCALA